MKQGITVEEWEQVKQIPGMTPEIRKALIKQWNSAMKKVYAAGQADNGIVPSGNYIDGQIDTLEALLLEMKRSGKSYVTHLPEMLPTR